MATSKGLLGMLECLWCTWITPFAWVIFPVRAQMHLPVRDLGASSHEFSSYLMSVIQHLFPAVCPLAGLLSYCILTSCVGVRGRIGKSRAVCGRCVRCSFLCLLDKYTSVLSCLDLQSGACPDAESLMLPISQWSNPVFVWTKTWCHLGMP